MKGQMGNEAIFVISVVIIILGLVIFSTTDKQLTSTSIKKVIDRRQVCEEFSNLVYSVYRNGDGSEANYFTDKIVTLNGDSTISVQDTLNITSSKIAVLLSEAGESQQEFYDIVKQKLNPDFYKNCFDDLPNSNSPGCQTTGSDVDWTLIPNNFSQLMINLSNYDVIYLEDAHIQRNANLSGAMYTELLKNWTSEGNGLILSEHVFCRTQNGPSGLDSYKCFPQISGDERVDTWQFLGSNIHQTGTSGFGSSDVVIIKDDPLYDLNVGQQIDFDEVPYVDFVSLALNSSATGTFGYFCITGSCFKNSWRNDTYYWHFGRTDNGDITGYLEFAFNLSSLNINKSQVTELNFTSIYCHSGVQSIFSVNCNGNPPMSGTFQGTQDVEVYNYTSGSWVDVGNLVTNDAEIETLGIWDISYGINDFIQVGTNLVRVRMELDANNAGSQRSELVIDYAAVVVNDLYNYQVVGQYMDLPSSNLDANDFKPAILYWSYDAGTVYYWGDFEIVPNQQTEYSNTIADLIGQVYLLEASKDPTICKLPFETSYYQKTGNITIKNIKNKILLTNSSS